MKTRTTLLRMFLLVLLGTMLGTMEVQAQRAVITSDGKTMYFCKDQSEAQSLGSQIFSIAIFTAGQSPAWYNNSAVDLTKITTVEFLPSFAEATNIRSAKDWFHGMTKLDRVIGMQNINNSGIWQFDSMFEGCTSLEFLYMNGLTGETTPTADHLSLNYMFKDCTKLKFVDLTNFSNVGGTRGMFSGCSSLKVLDLSSFKKSSNSSMREMFSGCSNLKTIHVGKGWNTTGISDADSQNMFYGCTSLVGGNGTSYNASYVGKEYSRIDADGNPGYFTKQAPYAVYDNGTLTFYTDENINSRVGTKYTIYKNPVTNNEYIYTGIYADGNYQNVTTVVFYNSLDPAPYCKSYYGNDGEFFWFYKMENLTHIGPMAYFGTSNLKLMSNMFYDCKSLTSLNLTYFNTSKATNMNYMFFHCESLTSLDLGTFNTQNVEKCEHMFAGCSNLKSIYVGEGWNVKSLLLSNASYMFDGCTNLVGSAGTVWKGNQYDDRQYAIVDGGTDNPGYLSNSPYAVLSSDETTFTFYADGKMSQKTGTKYRLCRWTSSSLANVTNVVFDSSFSTVRPTSTAYWFEGASKLTTITHLDYLNTSEVTTMEKMFNGCESLISANMSQFNTEKVTDMSSMFKDCKRLTSLNLNGFNTSEVTDMAAMFMNCSGITLLDLSSFNTANVTDMKSMFRGDSLLTTIFINSKWNIGKVTSYYSSYMFEGCVNLKGGAGTAYDESKVDKTYARADNAVGNPGYLSFKPYAVYQSASRRLFFYADGRPDVKIGTVYDLKRDETGPGWYFDEISPNVAVVDFDASFANARPVSTAYWFYGMTNLKSFTGIDNLNTSEVTTMRSMFYNCSALEMLNLSNFNTSKVTNMSYMFYGCSNLITVYVSDAWTTIRVSSSTSMFYNCSAIKGGNGTTYNSSKLNKEYARIDAVGTPGYFTAGPPPYAVLSGNTLTFYADGLQSEKTTGTLYTFPTVVNTDPDWFGMSVITKVIFDPSFANALPTSTYGWFCDLTNLTTIEGIEYLNTSKVTTMQNMFRNTKLTTLDLRYFNTANVTDMFAMFAENPQLTTILVGSNWSVEKVRLGSNMFSDCPNLVGGAGTRYNSNFTDVTYAHIDGGPSNPGYFTSPPPYAVLSEDGLTLTFYNDGLDGLKSGTVYSLNQGTDAPAWYTDNANGLVNTVVFDPSFANARPTTTNSWFVNMRNLTSIEGIQYLNTSEVTNMESMFSLCKKLESVDVSGFNTTKVTDMGSLFNECNILKTLDLTNFDVSQVTNMQNMFSNCTSLVKIYAGSNWNEGFSGNSSFMFANCPKLVGGAGTEWDSSLTDYISYAQFDGGEMDPGYFSHKPYAVCNTSDNTFTFYNDGNRASHTEGTVYDLNTGDDTPGWVENELFYHIKTVNFDPLFAFARPTSTYLWFGGMNNLTSINGLEYLNTSEVANMSFMFQNCSSLTTLDPSNWNTSNVEYMHGLFQNCSSLTTLDLTGWDTGKVLIMMQMFGDCSALTTIYIGDNWNLSALINGSLMFSNCPELVGGAGTKWDSSLPDNESYAQIDGGVMAPGYFTEGPARMLGDVNGDDQVNVADVTALVNLLKSGNVVYIKVADVDGDGSITDIDVKALVYNILGSYALMYVEDVFTLTDRGTVATGKILKGMFRKGQSIVLRSISDAIPDVEFTISGIEMFQQTVDVAVAGDNVGILVNVDKDNVQRGDVLTIKNNPDLLHSKTVKGTLYLLTKEEGGRHTPIGLNYKPQMVAGGVNFSAQLTDLGIVDGQAATMIMPGSTSENVVIEVIEDGKTPYTYPGQVVYLREGGKTIGRLTITE